MVRLSNFNVKMKCRRLINDQFWIQTIDTDFQNISDGEENRWESIRAKSDTNYNPTASVTNEKFFENIA